MGQKGGEERRFDGIEVFSVRCGRRLCRMHRYVRMCGTSTCSVDDIVSVRTRVGAASATIRTVVVVDTGRKSRTKTMLRRDIIQDLASGHKRISGLERTERTSDDFKLFDKKGESVMHAACGHIGPFVPDQGLLQRGTFEVRYQRPVDSLQSPRGPLIRLCQILVQRQQTSRGRLRRRWDR